MRIKYTKRNYYNKRKNKKNKKKHIKNKITPLHI